METVPVARRQGEAMVRSWVVASLIARPAATGRSRGSGLADSSEAGPLSEGHRVLFLLLAIASAAGRQVVALEDAHQGLRGLQADGTASQLRFAQGYRRCCVMSFVAYFTSSANSISFAQWVVHSSWKAKGFSLETLRPAANSNAPPPSFTRKLNFTVCPRKAGLHLRQLAPRDRALDEVPVHDELRIALHRPAVDRRLRLAREEVLAHHAGAVEAEDLRAAAIGLPHLVQGELVVGVEVGAEAGHRARREWQLCLLLGGMTLKAICTLCLPLPDGISKSFR